MNVWGFKSRTRRKSISTSASNPSNLRANVRVRPSSGQAIDQLEADVVPCALILAARVAQADHQLHRRQSRGSREAPPGSSSQSRSCGPRPAPSDQNHDSNQSSFSFSLRSALMTSGCSAPRPDGLRLLLFLDRPEHDVSQEQFRIRVNRDIRRQGQVAHMNAFIDLEMADIHLERIGNGARAAGDLQAVDQVFEDATGRDTGGHASRLERQPRSRSFPRR